MHMFLILHIVCTNIISLKYLKWLFCSQGIIIIKFHHLGTGFTKLETGRQVP
jgi:hypothetical protein